MSIAYDAVSGVEEVVDEPEAKPGKFAILVTICRKTSNTNARKDV